MTDSILKWCSRLDMLKHNAPRTLLFLHASRLMFEADSADS